MKKILSSALFIIIFGVYVMNHYFGSTSYVASANFPVSEPAQTAQYPTPSSGSSSKGSQTSTKKQSGQYSDGTYTGSVADAYYGNIQVEAKISNGRISDVVFLQYPNDRSTSRFINGQAMPLLKSEAIQAQTANVDTISGATDTSAAFRESLSSALTKARA